MKELNLKISIAHLFPELNLYGDNGNLLALKQRCLWRGISVDIDEIDYNSDLCEHDLYFIAGGTDKQQINVASWLVSNNKFFNEEFESGSVFLGISGGYELLSKSFQVDNNDYNGLGLLNVNFKKGEKRLTGTVIATSNISDKDIIVGFENHINYAYLEKGTTPLAMVKKGYGNNINGGIEGAYSKTAFGVNLHGPFLPKNPRFTDYLIELALNKRYGNKLVLSKLDDTFENKAREVIIGKAH